MKWNFTREQWLQTIAHFHERCAYCGIHHFEEYDHFIPWTKGGKSTIDNFIPACRACNLRKSNHTGSMLIALFGKEKIEQLQEYLATRIES